MNCLWGAGYRGGRRPCGGGRERHLAIKRRSTRHPLRCGRGGWARARRAPHGRPRRPEHRPGTRSAPQYRKDRTWRLVHVRIGGRWCSDLLTVWRRPAGSAVWVAHVRWGEDLNWAWLIYDPATIRIAPRPTSPPARPRRPPGDRTRARARRTAASGRAPGRPHRGHQPPVLPVHQELLPLLPDGGLCPGTAVEVTYAGLLLDWLAAPAPGRRSWGCPTSDSPSPAPTASTSPRCCWRIEVTKSS